MTEEQVFVSYSSSVLFVVCMFAMFCFLFVFLFAFSVGFGVFFLFPYFTLPHLRLQFRHILWYLHRAAISSTDAFYNLFPENKQNIRCLLYTEGLQ